MNNSGNSNSNGNTPDGPDTGNGPQRLSDVSENTANTGAQSSENSEGALRAEAEKFKGEYLYLRAEFENYKKQVLKERSDLRKYGSERLINDLLNVLDIFETALATEVSAENIANFLKGIEMTAVEMRSVLSRHGVEEIPAAGQPFDPSVHEALSSEETDEVPSGTITRVFKKPYKLHDRVVRPGQVVVAKPKA